MDADGSNQINVTNDSADDWEPAWMPVVPAPAPVPPPPAPIPAQTAAPTQSPAAMPTVPAQSVPKAPVVDPADDWGPSANGAYGYSGDGIWNFVWPSGYYGYDYYCVGYEITQCPVYVHWLDGSDNAANFRVYTASGVLSDNGNLHCSSSARQLLAELGPNETGLRVKLPIDLFAVQFDVDVTCLVVVAFNSVGESAALQAYLRQPSGE
jgi:hypothetical protein